MNETIRKTYNRRVEQARERIIFHLQPELISKSVFADVVRLRKFFGMSKGKDVRLWPVFDELVLSTNGTVAFCRIDELWTFFDTQTGEEILTNSFPSLPIDHAIHHTLELVVDIHRHGLYDVRGKQLLLEAEFDDVDCSGSFSHLWVRKGGLWGYVNKKTKKETLVSDMDMAYEAEGGLFLRYGDKIICVDENGSSDIQALRRFVFNNQGRGMVHNDKYHETVYFNIYGDILH